MEQTHKKITTHIEVMFSNRQEHTNAHQNAKLTTEIKMFLNIYLSK